jgi:hypothetical protein
MQMWKGSRISEFLVGAVGIEPTTQGTGFAGWLTANVVDRRRKNSLYFPLLARN